ncbi:MAG: helix-turn-helix domain-containing protein [Chthoniobacterales bacterium]
MPRFRRTVPVDDYVLDVLMRDLVGHDRQPAAFLVYLHLYHAAQRLRWRPVCASLRAIAEGTGLSKSAVQLALERLRRRELIQSTSAHATALPEHRVLRHWRQPAAPQARTAPARKRRRIRSR